MFFKLSQIDFASYADDNTPYGNQMKANKDKCHLLISNNKKVSMKIDNIELENTSSKKLLGIIIDSKLNFKEHLEGITKKASRKVNV